jgi:hypothetical protein
MCCRKINPLCENNLSAGGDVAGAVNILFGVDEYVGIIFIVHPHSTKIHYICKKYT